MLKAAINYGRRGWFIHPLKPMGKEPLTDHWKDSKSRDEEQIKKWWARWPDANIAIVTGAESGIIVLDVDDPEGEALVEKNKGCKTLISETGNGYHFVFKHPGYKVRNFVRKMPGLDLRGDGGYIVAPPSIHPNGHVYDWQNFDEPADAPQWLLKLITEQNGPAPKVEGDIPQGQRNNVLASLAGTMRHRGMSEESILAALKVENQRCNPPLQDHEVQAIAQSISQYEPTKPPEILDDAAIINYAQLWDQVYNHLYDNIDYIDDIYYTITTSWALATWKIETLDEVGYLLLRGHKGSGKTRVMEVLQPICYHPDDAALCSVAAIYRDLVDEDGEQQYKTMFMDEFGSYSKEKTQALIQILNSGYTRGKKMKLCDPDKRNKVVKYPTFGFKTIGTIEGVAGPFESRCIPIPMIRNTRAIKYRIDKEQAKKIRANILTWHTQTKDTPPKTTEEAFFSHGITNYRLIQTLNAILAMTPPEKRPGLLTYAKDRQTELDDEEDLSFSRDIYFAIKAIYKDTEGGFRFPIKEIADTLRPNYPEIEHRKIGSELNKMGITAKARFKEIGLGRKITPRLFKRLAKRYDRGQTGLEGFGVTCVTCVT